MDDDGTRYAARARMDGHRERSKDVEKPSHRSRMKPYVCLVSVLCLMWWSCRTPPIPAVQPPFFVTDPDHAAGSILIKADVDDRAKICLEAVEPNDKGEACFLTVGDLRRGHEAQRRAD